MKKHEQKCVSAGAGADSFVWSRPADVLELQRLVREGLGIRVPSRAGRSGVGGVGGVGGPLEYLWHAVDDSGCGGVGSGRAGGVRDSVVWACRGGGKTMLGALATALDMVLNPGIQVRILAGSLEQGSRMQAHLRGLFARPTLAPLVKGRVTERKIELNQGSRVEVLAQSQTSVRGTRVHRLRCDEVELFDPEVWEAAQLVTRSEELGGRLVRGSVEALSTMHMPFGLMSTIVASCAVGARTLFKWGVAESLGPCVCDEEGRARCPVRDECQMRGEGGRGEGGEAGHITVEDATRLKRRVSTPVWESEMLCIRPSRRETVFPEFDEGVHVVDELPREVERDAMWVGGMDFGFRTSALLWAAHDRVGGGLYIVDERVEHNTLLRDHIDALLSGVWPVPEWLGVDPAGKATSDQSGRSNIEILRRSGLRVEWRKVETRAGLDMVRARLRPAAGPARLFIHRRCARLIEAMRAYHFDPDDATRERPVKDGHDHVADALRYLVVCLDKGFLTRVGRYT